MGYGLFGVRSIQIDTYKYYQHFTTNRTWGIPENNSGDSFLELLPRSIDVVDSGFNQNTFTFIPFSRSSGPLLTNVPFLIKGFGSYIMRPGTGNPSGEIYVGLRFTHFSDENFGFSITNWTNGRIATGQSFDLLISKFSSEIILGEFLSSFLLDRAGSVISIKQDMIVILYTSDEPERKIITDYNPAVSYSRNDVVFTDTEFYRSDVDNNLDNTPGVGGIMFWVKIGDLVFNPYRNYQGFTRGDTFLVGGTRRAGNVSVDTNLASGRPRMVFEQFHQSEGNRAKPITRAS